MKNKEWVKRVISHEEGLPVPYAFAFSPPARKLAEEYYKQGPIEEVLNFPIQATFLNETKPLFADPAIYGEKVKDDFGVVWKTNYIDRGVPIVPCLIKPSLKGYKFPEASASYRFEGIGKWCIKNKEYFKVIWIGEGELWERVCFMRGFENAFLDLILNAKFFEELLIQLTDYHLETMKILFERFEFDAIGLSDDYGSERSLLISPSQWRKFFKPHLKKIYNFAKKNGKKVVHHSCGHVYPLIGEMIDIGLDILHPVQPEAMDIYRLKKEFGENVTLWGGLGTQKLLPYGKIKEITDEVECLKKELGKGGGYILGGGLTIQADVSIERIIALMDEAKR